MYKKKIRQYSSQLFRYFVTTSAKFAILTNGNIYKFYTDLDETNKMDKEPFMEIDLLNITDVQATQLEKFHKNKLNIPEILDTASILKYNTLFIKSIEQQFANPSDEFVKLFLQPHYKGTKTQNVIEKFRPIFKKAFTDYMNENINDKIKLALNSTVITTGSNRSDFTANEDLDAIKIVKDILKDTVDGSQLSYKYTESYTAILYQNNVRKWVCRLNLSSQQKILIIPDENKKEQRYPIKNLQNLYDFSNELKRALKRYQDADMKNLSEKLYTKWGTYEMPQQYVLDLSYGPRGYLKYSD